MIAAIIRPHKPAREGHSLVSEIIRNQLKSLMRKLFISEINEIADYSLIGYPFSNLNQ